MEVESDMEDMIDDIENENNLEEESRTEVKVEMILSLMSKVLNKKFMILSVNPVVL